MNSKKNTVNWGVLGTAGIAERNVIPAMILAENCKLYAIAGRRSEKVESFKDKFGFEKSYISYDELLDDDNIDVVYIPLPNDLHKEWAINAAKKKKHILLEKPFTVSKKDAEEIIVACKENGVLIMEAFAYLHNDAIISLTNAVNENKIGKVKFIETTFIIGNKPNTDIRMKKENYGGATFDVGCYNISLILNLLKKRPSKVKAVAFQSDTDVDITCSTLLEFESGQYASSLVGMCATVRGDRLLIYGEKGNIEAKIPYNANGELSYRIITPESMEEFKFNVRNNYVLEVEQFSKCVLGLDQPLVTNEFSLLVAEVIDDVLKEINY